MILVFNAGVIRLGTFGAIKPLISRAASAAAEITNVIEWIVQVDT
jgi:hypothetical protein